MVNHTESVYNIILALLVCKQLTQTPFIATKPKGNTLTRLRYLDPPHKIVCTSADEHSESDGANLPQHEANDGELEIAGVRILHLGLVDQIIAVFLDLCILRLRVSVCGCVCLCFVTNNVRRAMAARISKSTVLSGFIDAVKLGRTILITLRPTI